MIPDERLDDQVRESYRRPIAGEAEARERAIARLRQEAARRPVQSMGWWLDPDALTLRPAVAAASVLVALAIGAYGGARWMAAQRVPAPAATPSIAMTASERTMVTFVFRAPGATHVSLVGDFNGWDPEATPLARATSGDAWTTRVPLENGLHTYAFVIDGREWAADPSAPLAPVATFGRRNSMLVVGEDHVL